MLQRSRPGGATPSQHARDTCASLARRMVSRDGVSRFRTRGVLATLCTGCVEVFQPVRPDACRKEASPAADWNHLAESRDWQSVLESLSVKRVRRLSGPPERFMFQAIACGQGSYPSASAPPRALRRRPSSTAQRGSTFFVTRAVANLARFVRLDVVTTTLGQLRSGFERHVGRRRQEQDDVGFDLEPHAPGRRLRDPSGRWVDMGRSGGVDAWPGPHYQLSFRRAATAAPHRRRLR